VVLAEKAGVPLVPPGGYPPPPCNVFKCVVLQLFNSDQLNALDSDCQKVIC
jgi:hypothetical protein